MDDSHLYIAAGGEAAFIELVEHFYAGVEADAALRALYPSDLEPGKRALKDFLVQRFGGPATYSEQRGHPRLRMRHARFAIDQAMRDAWVRHMHAAVCATASLAPHEPMLMAYFEDAATFLLNA
jgi:hemoglobin